MPGPRTIGVFLAAVLSLPTSANAFTLYRADDGTPVRWNHPTVPVVVDASITDIAPVALGAASEAFATWTSVPDAAVPAVVLQPGIVDGVGYRAGEVNHNTLRYVAGGFAPAGAALAITVLTFNDAGSLLDADIIVNGDVERRFEVLSDEAPRPDDANTFDLQDVLTHEAGHFLGMAHNGDDVDVTMYPDICPCETSKRVLHQDDEQGLRSVYSSALPGASCATVQGSAVSSGGPLMAAVAAWGVSFARRAHRRCGPLLALVATLGAVVLGAPAQAHSEATIAAASTLARVIEATPRWEGGLIVTQLALETEPGQGGSSTQETIDVLGGAIDGVTQIVSEHELPALGAKLAVRVSSDGHMQLPVHVSRWRPSVRHASTGVPASSAR